MGEPSSSWQNFNFRDDEGSAQGMQALRLLLAKLQEAQANPRLKPSVNNLLMTEDLMLTSTQRLPSSVAPMHLEGGEGVPVMHGPMQANVVPHPLQGPLQTDGAKKKQYHGQERHVGKIREEGDFHDDDDEPPSRSRHKKRTNERRTKRSRRNSSGGSSSSSQSGRSSHGRFPKKGNLTRFEYPKLARFCQAQEEFAEVHDLSQSGKLWKHLSAGDLPESEWLTVFDTPKYKAAKADPEVHKVAWALFAENLILSLKHNFVAWKRKVDAFRDTHGPINVITTGDFMSGPSMQADVKGRPEPCFMSSVIKNLHTKILDIQSHNKAKVLKNELKERKAEFLNKRVALIRREATTSAASMIQTKITSLQTRYGTLIGANATTEQLVAMEAQITTMSNAVKLIEGDDKIADMKIIVESIEEPTVSNVKTEVSGITNKLAYVELLTVVSYSFHHFVGWSDAEAAHHMSFETSHGYTENAIGVEEGDVFDLGIASPGGAEKSWSDRKAAKNVGHDTVPLNQLYLVQRLRRA
ncbi:hypothetical protein L7F22_066532 [Adiantum nelumboides]|nr:hypothetical protein [Adiantum nelumboides]